MKTNEARETAAADHSLSRFMGSKRTMGDDIEQSADLVYTDKRQLLCKSLKAEIVAYLNNPDPKAQRARTICDNLDCHCGNGRTEPCDCAC